ncbi:thioredoxin family protein [Thermoleophilia bacterium SCSIO 60948]|nr:thioredoxin family protein [Thermoleophilia bacterium SCSIO 60948]
MRVELLYFDGCPSYKALLPELRAALKREGFEDEVELRRVETLEAAEAEGFLGSPSVRINGEDIDPGAGDRSDFGLKCRLYRSAQGTSGIPPQAWLVDALRRQRSESPQ